MAKTATKAPAATPAPAAVKASTDTATITYHIGKAAHDAELNLPVGRGVGERLLNRIEAEGCTDINAVRQQISALPHANGQGEDDGA